MAAAGVTLALLVGVGYGVYRAVKSARGEAAHAEACADVKALEASLADQRELKSAGDGPLLAVIGDSYASGLYSPEPMKAFPYLVGEALGDRVWVDGSGGSGYVSEGPCGDADIGSRIESMLAMKPETLIVQAGINDRGLDGLSAAVAGVFDEISEAEVSRVVIVGPFAPPLISGAQTDSVNDVLSAAARDHGFEYWDGRALRFSLLEDDLHPDPDGQQAIAAELLLVLE